MRRRRDREIELILAGKEIAPGLIDILDPLWRDRMVGQHRETRIAKRACQNPRSIRCPVIHCFDLHCRLRPVAANPSWGQFIFAASAPRRGRRRP